MHARCCYAPAGSYGHECGLPAQYVRPIKSQRTISGIFYAARCRDCADRLEIGERTVGDLEPFDYARHKNDEWITPDNRR